MLHVNVTLIEWTGEISTATVGNCSFSLFTFIFLLLTHNIFLHIFRTRDLLFRTPTLYLSLLLFINFVLQRASNSLPSLNIWHSEPFSIPTLPRKRRKQHWNMPKQTPRDKLFLTCIHPETKSIPNKQIAREKFSLQYFSRSRSKLMWKIERCKFHKVLRQTGGSTYTQA